MRVTKAMLEQRIKRMEAFMRLPIQYAEDEREVRDADGFDPVERFASGIPMENEAGRINGVRILIGQLTRWEPK